MRDGSRISVRRTCVGSSGNSEALPWFREVGLEILLETEEARGPRVASGQTQQLELLYCKFGPWLVWLSGSSTSL